MIKLKLFTILFCLNHFLSYSQVGTSQNTYYNSNTSEGKELVALVNGKFGYRSERGGVNGNIQFYSDQGYTISYQYSDFKIYGLSAILIIGLGLIIYFRKKNSTNK